MSMLGAYVLGEYLGLSIVEVMAQPLVLRDVGRPGCFHQRQGGGDGMWQ